MRRRIVAELLILAALLLLLLVDHWIFARWLGTSYVRWYVATGPWIGLGTTLMAYVWTDLDRHPGLYSASPAHYVGSWCQLVGATLIGFSTRLSTRRGSIGFWRRVDVLLASLLTFAVCLGLVAWLLVVMPAQYLVYVLCGAPSRVFQNSPLASALRFDGPRVEVRPSVPGGELPAGWWEDGLTKKPLSVTATFATVLLLLVRGALG